MYAYDTLPDTRFEVWTVFKVSIEYDLSPSKCRRKDISFTFNGYRAYSLNKRNTLSSYVDARASHFQHKEQNNNNYRKMTTTFNE